MMDQQFVLMFFQESHHFQQPGISRKMKNLVQNDEIIVLERCIFQRSEENKSELKSLMRISYAVLCLKKQKKIRTQANTHKHNTDRQMNRHRKQQKTQL